MKIACMAQLVNVIALIMTAPGGGAWAQTIYWPLIKSPVYGCQGYEAVPYVDAAATVDEAGQVTIFAINRGLQEDARLEADLRGFGKLAVAAHHLLHHEDVKAENTQADPTAWFPFPLRMGSSQAADWKSRCLP